MAEELSRIFGTELDRVNCAFFFKIGACRHGEKCDRRHNRPTESPTVLFPNMLQLPPSRFTASNEVILSKEEMEAFDDFYEDIFVELSKTGEIEDLIISANPGLHLNGNVYVKFRNEKMAAAALVLCNGRLYDGRPLRGELSLVTEFGEARCRQYANGECDRKMCNFLHLAEPSRQLKHQLFSWQAQKVRQKATEDRRQKRHESRPDPFGRDVRYVDDRRREDDRRKRQRSDYERDRDREKSHSGNKYERDAR